MNFLGLDVGTTCCKCQLFDETGEILFYRAEECALKTIKGEQYVDIETIVKLVRSLIRQAAAEQKIDSLAISSFGEAFVLLDKADNVLFYPMLYTDPRGEKQAEEWKIRFGERELYAKTGVLPHAMYSVSKLLWIRENYPAIFEKADKVMLIGDYLGYLLTGERAIDYGLAARTGVFDIRGKRFAEELLSSSGISPALFSAPRPAGSVVGKISAKTAKELDLNADCLLVLGSHDQICATLGAGVLHAGEAADGMGTVECITAVFDKIPDSPDMGAMGYPVVPYGANGLYCTYILNYSSGSLVNWLRKKIMHGYAGDKENFFAYMESSLTPWPTGLLALPYFAGAATPYQDSSAKGAVLGLTLQTTDAQLYQSLLEGTSLEMRLNLETVKAFGIQVNSAAATGGGANSEGWLQIKANATGLALRTLRSSEGGLCGVAMLQAAALGAVKDLEEAKNVFVRYTKEIVPDEKYVKAYDETYERYKKLYKTIKELSEK